MSDEFDKEAEREKLREKYERDQQKREATEQMSELLLQGATMTNAHCSDCGDPIFRYDGQEFCPTCEKPVDRETGADGDEGEADGGDQIEVTTPSEEARVAFGDDAENGAEGAETADAGPGANSQAEGTTAGAGSAATDDSSADAPSETGRQPSAQAPEQGARLPAQRDQGLPAEEHDQPTPDPETLRAQATADARGEASVTAARESLVRTLTRFSRLAEQTDDPRRAQEHLAAAREAAETLAELRR